jgi:hypothetical protein
VALAIFVPFRNTLYPPTPDPESVEAFQARSMRLLDWTVAVSPAGTVGGVESPDGSSRARSTGRMAAVHTW